MIGNFGGFFRFYFFIQNLEYFNYCRVSECSPSLKNVPQVVYYKKQVGDFGAIFVRNHPLAPGHIRHIRCRIAAQFRKHII